MSPGRRERDREKDREKEKDKDKEGGGEERYFSNGPDKSGEAGGVEVGLDSPLSMDVKEGQEGKEEKEGKQGKEGKPLKDAKEGKEVKAKEGREGREDLNVKIKINTIGSPRVAAKEAREKDVKARNKARAQVVKTVSDEGCACVRACVRACVARSRHQDGEWHHESMPHALHNSLYP